MRYRTTVAAVLVASVWTAIGTSCASAQAYADASSLSLRSGGKVAGPDVTLDSNGFLGTYITLAAPGEVTFAIDAAGIADGGSAPRLTLAVDDFTKSFDVAPGTNAYRASTTLPAGTHFVRLGYGNASSTAAARAITLKRITVTGAQLANAATDTNALAAANTYIANFRKGPAHVTLTGPGDVPLLEGTPVRATLVRNAFNFGGTVSGAGIDDVKDMLGVANPAAGTQQQKFQDFVKKNFNMIVPSNGAKWAYTEPTRGQVNMALPDRQLDWAIANHKRARMHNLLWGAGPTSGRQQPDWVNDLIAKATSGDAKAKADLRAAISDRIKYYAGTDANRSRKYVEIDGLNESLHNPSYMNIFGNAGMADIYNELDAAIAAAGSTAKTYLNEYNLLQYAPASIDPVTGKSTGFDPYANYYRQHIDQIREAGGKVGGVGVQYYVNFNQTGENAHSAATMQKAIANFSVPGLPISLTEFGGTNSMKGEDNAAGVKVLDEAMRMVFGTPAATTFVIWGWWDVPTNPTPPAALLDNTKGNAELTPMGHKWEQLMAEFSTDVTEKTDAKGAIDFTGFYGDYNIGKQSAYSNLTLVKGTIDYTLKLDAPPTWSFFKPDAGGGRWTAALTWSAGVPDAVGATAHLPAADSPRVIEVDRDITIGQLNFDGGNAYTLAGSRTITLESKSGAAAVTVIAGSHAVDVPLTLASDARIVVRRADSTLKLCSIADAPLRSLTKVGDGALALNHARLASLSIEGGRIAMRAGLAVDVNIVGRLSIAEGASLELGDSPWAIEGESSRSLLADVHRLIASGRITVAAKTDPRRAVGWSEASHVAPTVLAGKGIAPTAVVFRATWCGDSNLDGVVDYQDLVRLAEHFNTAAVGRGWSEGDSTGDGRVDFADLVALLRNYGRRATMPADASPLVLAKPVATDTEQRN